MDAYANCSITTPMSSICVAKSSKSLRILTLSSQGQHKQVLHVFHEMQGQGLPPERYVLPSVLRACAHLSDIRTGKILHNTIIRCLHRSDAFIDATLMDMYSKCGHVCIARRVFEGMSDKDLVVWNSMISGYAHHGLLGEAMSLFKQMRSSGTNPDLVTWNTLISGFAQAGEDKIAQNLLSLMQFNGVEPDVFSWTSIISGLVYNFHYQRAFKMFKQMVEVAQVQPNSATISSLLPACATVADSGRGKQIHAYSLVLGLEEELHVSSSLVDMYAKGGLIFEAGKIFNRMRKRSTVSWNSMIFGYANHGYCNQAIKLLYQMKEEGFRPDHVTFTAVFTACSNAGMVEVGKCLFKIMQKEHRIEPRLVHYACMVDLLGRAGKLVEAYEFIKNMPIRPDSFVWGALLGASRKHGDIALATIAASHLSELERKRAGSCLLLYNLLADAERWEEAVETRKHMRSRKSRRYFGCSWMLAR